MTLRINSAPQIFRCEPTWRWSPDLIDHDLWCILKGRGEITLNGKAIILRAGSLFVLAPNQRVHAVHDPDDRLSVFAVHFDVLDGKGNPMCMPETELPKVGYVMADLSLLNTLAQACMQAYREDTTEGRQRACGYLDVIRMHARDDGRRDARRMPDPRVARVLDAILEDPARNWTVATLSRIAHLSNAQFSKVFTTEVGLSPVAFAVNTKIGRAKELLRETSMNVTEIAEALGYKDVFHFSHQFKKIQGVPPSRLRSK